MATSKTIVLLDKALCKGRENNMLLSLCIPTNGITEWVIPVLDSIYNQNVDNEFFEVIITDNGGNSEFEKAIKAYAKNVANLLYKKTKSTAFLNQIECFEMASGDFIKFVNHRMPLLQGTLEKLVQIAKTYRNIRPNIFFTNGSMPSEEIVSEFSNYDEYISHIGYMASWSGGTAIWREEFQKKELSYYNELFPHISFVLEKNRNNVYIVDNTRIFELLRTDETKKGKYKIYQAFAVELPMIFTRLFQKNLISWMTYKRVMKQIEVFLANQFRQLEIERKPCSYDLTGFNEYVSIFFNPNRIRIMAFARYLKHKLIRGN